MAELWDIYDKDGNKLGITKKRGEKLNDDEYHLVVNVWIKNKNNEFLISQRSANKTYPHMWECTGGSAVLGEDAISACIREVKEELGIDINKDCAKHVGRKLRYYPNCPDILDVWVFESDADISEVTIQEEEVENVMWANADKIRKLKEEGKFEANYFFEEALNS